MRLSRYPHLVVVRYFLYSRKRLNVTFMVQAKAYLGDSNGHRVYRANLLKQDFKHVKHCFLGERCLLLEVHKPYCGGPEKCLRGPMCPFKARVGA